MAVIGFLFVLLSGEDTLAPFVQGFILSAILIVLLNNAAAIKTGESSAFAKLGGA